MEYEISYLDHNGEWQGQLLLDSLAGTHHLRQIQSFLEENPKGSAVIRRLD